MRRPRTAMLLKAGVSLALVAFLFAYRPLSWSTLRAAVAAPQWPWLALSGCLFALSAVCGALQWAWILRGTGLRVTISEAVRLSFVGLFFNNFLLGNVGGDAYKVVDLGRREGRTAAVLGATLLDRLLGLLALTLLALLAVPTAVAAGVRVPPTLPLWLALAAWGVAFAVLFSALGAGGPRPGGRSLAAGRRGPRRDADRVPGLPRPAGLAGAAAGVVPVRAGHAGGDPPAGGARPGPRPSNT